MKKINKFILNQAKRKIRFIYIPLKDRMKKTQIKKAAKYAYLYKKNKVNSNCILYQSRDGKSLTDNPYAVFLYLLNNENYKHMQHVWVVDSKQKKKYYENEYSEFKNISFIIKESDQYLDYLTKAKYVLNNSTFPPYFTKKEDQVYVNTWHGTPIKNMGLDVEDSLLSSQNIIKNFLSSDILVSPNTHTTDIFKRAYKLDGLYNGNLLEIGYPRIDLTINSNKSNVIQHLSKNKIEVENKKVLLFAPTWRGKNMNKPEDDIESILETVKELKKNTDYQVLVKVHPFTYQTALKYEQLKEFLVPDTFDTNELLGIIDLLVTDYSSIFFDYLVTNNPIIFYSPDYKEYETARGFYIKLDELPGPSVFDLKSLILETQNIYHNKEKYKGTYEQFKNSYVPHENGKVTEKLVSNIFKQDTSNTLKTKKTILMYAGGMKNNGITTSSLNLLENLDYEKYDVTVFLGNTKKAEVLKNLKEVNGNVRIILRKGPLLATTLERYRDIFVKNRGLNTIFEKLIYPNSTYQREFRKIFGNSIFDYAIDFSGYSMFWSKILLAAKSDKKLVYLHSDMKSDMYKIVNGKKPHYSNLKGLISLYDRFDYLVNVSKETCNINKKNLSTPATKNKFITAMNTINLNKINNLVTQETDFFINKENKVLAFQQGNEIKSVEFNKEDFKVMAMGRFSPEKGFDILIKAFKKIVEINSKAKLYILGSGVLRPQLEELISNLELDKNVYLIGQKYNPFNIMKQCDLFVLSSHYEGQSMVLLEALTIKTNVLASDIPANRYVLNNGEFGMLSQNNPEMIGKGIYKFMIKDTPEYKDFDAYTHNKEAMKEFYSLLE